MRALALALRTLLREWRSGELGVLVLAITVAVAALTGVGFLVDRIGIAVDNQAGEVLAADLRLESGQAMDDNGHRRSAATRSRDGSQHGPVQRGVQRRFQPAHLVARGVGEIPAARQGDALATNRLAPPELARGIPARGEVWPDSRLAAALGASVGTQLNIGASTFRVSRVLISRPDQGATFLELAPSLIMNEEDLATTQLIQPGSRVRRAQLFAGPRNEYRRIQGLARGQQEAERGNRRRRRLGAADQVRHRPFRRDSSASPAWWPCCCAPSPSRWPRAATCSDISIRWRC